MKVSKNNNVMQAFYWIRLKYILASVLEWVCIKVLDKLSTNFGKAITMFKNLLFEYEANIGKAWTIDGNEEEAFCLIVIQTVFLNVVTNI